MRIAHMLRAALILMGLLLSPVLWANQFDMTPGVTEISREVFQLHRTILWICVAIGAIVFGLMFWAIIHHRKSKGAQAAHFHESTLVEIIWTIIPFIILIGMAVPATRVLIAMSNTDESELTVRVTGSQWKWHYEYLSYKDRKDLGLGFFSNLSTPRSEFERYEGGFSASNIPDFKKYPNYLVEVDNPLVIPSGVKVRFLLTADDVIHAWWVPDFALKKDAVPGFINEMWANVPEGKEGIYRGRCAELCGKDHAFMPIVVQVVSPADFDVWLQEAGAAEAKKKEEAAQSVNYVFADLKEAMTVGESVYNSKCAACHQVNGEGLPPMFPALKGSKMATQKDQISAHIKIVLDGLKAMPGWKQQISAKEIAAVITYERNAWGNNTGDLIQPAELTSQ